MASSPLQGSGARLRRWWLTVWDDNYAREVYNRKPNDRPGRMVEVVEVVPRADAEALIEALEIIAADTESEASRPWTDLWRANFAHETLAAYRAKHPTSVGKSGDAATKPASELERGPEETT